MLFERIYRDDKRLSTFVKECNSLGYKNNRTVNHIKFDYFDHSAFFAGIIDDSIRIFSGVHNFDYEGDRYWRVGFRAVSLYENKVVFSKNLRKASMHQGVIVTLQMMWVEQNFGRAKFVLTSNDMTASNNSAGKSHRIDRLLHNNGLSGASLLAEKVEYLHTVQNIWLLDQNYWYRDFEDLYSGKINISTIDFSKDH